ncbi:alpha/beta hydrolase [Streptomyces sp. NPDC093094]|uniref:alpha/beta hydrolase n=1 Tax=Streptomyces sp. NPDC093094 TaxID=3366026 RepID=UPI0038091B3D
MTKPTRTTRVLSLSATAAAAALVLGLTPAATASPAPAAPTTALRWAPCDGPGLDPRQQCADLLVPMDYADPRGKKIRIAVSRLPGENPSARRGALLLIPGGPGGTSLDQPSEKARVLPKEVRDAYDLIGFAPRGMAPSTAVSCGLAPSDLAATKLRPWPGPDGSVAGNMDSARRMSQACARNGGELIRHISTANEARDLDRVRAALGERRISAWGVSYGTYVGAVYGRLFPGRTDRFVLDSSGNPDHTRVGRAWLAGFERGVEDTFPEFARYASAPGTPHRVASTPAGVRRVLLELAARLDREPLPWPGANPPVLDGNELRQAMLNAFYDPDGFPALAELIDAARTGKVPPAPQAPPQDVMQNVTAVAMGTICNDVAFPASAAAYQEEVDTSRAAFPLTAGMPRSPMACAAWPFAPQEPPVRITDEGRSSFLLVQNERDVATPLSGARAMRAALGRRAVMVTVNSTGHDAYLGNGNACGDAAVSRFLATGRRPAADLYCR